jgi:hypothetical protein
LEIPFTIMIPVFNETRVLQFSDFYFRRFDIPVVYALDSQHTPEARRTLRALDRDFRTFDNDRPFIESGYASFAAASPTDWILRLDCDELPTPELIAAGRDFVAGDPHETAGFERCQLTWRDDRFYACTSTRFAPANQVQWRLFNRRRATFTPQIHTAGIALDAPVTLRGAARIYHLSWIFLSWEDRLRKAARYDSHGQADANRLNQLFPLAEAHWEELDAPELTGAYRDWLDAAPTPKETIPA